jgi:hypothetical protein
VRAEIELLAEVVDAGDRDLLIPGEHRGTRVVTPRDFASRL